MLFSTQRIDFSYSTRNICCGFSLEAPHRGASNEYPQQMFSWINDKNISLILALIWNCVVCSLPRSWLNSAEDKVMIHFLFFPRNQDDISCNNLLEISNAVFFFFLLENKKKKKISECRLKFFLPRMLSVNDSGCMA